MDNITNSIIFYSVALKDFEELDFKNDALAGVRSCYFRENLTPQQGDTIRHFEEEKFNYCYTLEQDKPMLWKVFKNRQLVQGTKYLPDDMYCICYYNNDELITKKVYFNKEHYWTKTEYFKPENGNECICSIAPKIINGYFALLKTVYNQTGYSASPLYMVSEMPAYELCDAVAYSDRGMLYFTTEAPSNIIIDEVEVKGFTFTPHDFNLAKNLNSTFDISSADYLTETNGKPFDEKAEPENIYSNSQDIVPDNFDVNETNETTNVTFENNENLLSEEVPELTENTVLEPTEEIKVEKVTVQEVNEEIIETIEPVEANYSNIIAEETNVSEDIIDNNNSLENTIVSEVVEETKEESIETTLESTVEETSTELPPEQIVKENTSDNDDYNDTSFVLTEKPVSDKVILDEQATFKYFGSLDSNGNRSGYGRTETSQGKTAYEGEYKDDMRNGFGSFYYKDGTVNYVGNWKDNLRDGRGIGFRSSDSQVHVGKWKDNMPDDIGVRFDKDGNFISLNNYSMGNKDGIGISFDSNGNLVISKWKNNNEVDSTIIIIND